MRARGRLRTATAGVVVVLLAGAGGAGALPQSSQARESFGAGSYLPAAPVALMGDGVAWGVYRRDGGFELRTGRAGVARTLRVRANSRRQHYFRLALVGSPVGLLSDEAFVYGGEEHVSLGDAYGSFLTSPSGAVTRIVPRCQGGSSADIDGSAAVVRLCDGRAEVRRVEGGASTLLRAVPASGIPGTAIDHQIAGRYVAYRTDASTADEIIVYDWEGGVALYRVRAPVGSVASLDVQSDGKIAFSYISDLPGDTVKMQAAWASPQEPFAHVLPLVPRTYYRVKLRRDIVAFVGSSAESPGEGRRAELGVVGLRGSPRVLARPVSGERFSDLFDFDDQHVAYVSPSCRGPRAVRQAVDEAPQLARSRRCALALSRRLRIDRRGRLIVGLSGRGLARDCSADRLRVTAGAGRGRVTLAAVRSRRGRASFRARLTANGQRLLRRRRRVRVTVAARVSDSEVATQRTRKTRARLSIPRAG